MKFGKIVLLVTLSVQVEAHLPSRGEKDWGSRRDRERVVEE